MLVDHLIKTKKKYKNLKNQGIQDILMFINIQFQYQIQYLSKRTR